MPDPRVCCVVGVCCEPPNQAKEVLAYTGAGAGEKPEDTVLAILGMFRLVPRTMSAHAPDADQKKTLGAQERLTKLNRHIDSELREVLQALGHEVGDERKVAEDEKVERKGRQSPNF